MLNKILLLFLSSLILSSNIQLKNIKDWDPKNKIDCTDFKGIVPIDSSDYTAVSRLAVYSEYDISKDSINYCIKAIFLNDSSWATECNKSILAHEQLHFDLTEICARKIKEQISINRKLLTPQKMDSIINYFFDQTEIIQKNYDKETNYGLNRKKQFDWYNKTQLQLNKLDLYKKKFNTIYR